MIFNVTQEVFADLGLQVLQSIWISKLSDSALTTTACTLLQLSKQLVCMPTASQPAANYLYTHAHTHAAHTHTHTRTLRYTLHTNTTTITTFGYCLTSLFFWRSLEVWPPSFPLSLFPFSFSLLLPPSLPPSLSVQSSNALNKMFIIYQPKTHTDIPRDIHTHTHLYKNIYKWLLN